MPPCTMRSTAAGLGLGLLLLLMAAACGSDRLPGFANPPPVDGGEPDASDDDAGSER